MLDIAPQELLLVAVVALLVIGPKDLPRVMRHVGRWMGKARGVARHFRAGFDQMVREAELEEMEKRWASENARIMREHPTAEEDPAATALPAPDAAGPAEPAPEGEAHAAEPHPDATHPAAPATRTEPPLP